MKSSRQFSFKKWADGSFAVAVTDRAIGRYLLIEGDGRQTARVVSVDGDKFAETTSRPFAARGGLATAEITVRGGGRGKAVARNAKRVYPSNAVRTDVDILDLKSTQRTSTWTFKNGERATAERNGDRHEIVFYDAAGQVRQTRTTVVASRSSQQAVLDYIIKDAMGQVTTQGQTVSHGGGLGAAERDIIGKNGQKIGVETYTEDWQGRVVESTKVFDSGKVVTTVTTGDVHNEKTITTVLNPGGSSSIETTQWNGSSVKISKISTDGHGNTTTDTSSLAPTTGGGSEFFHETKVNGEATERTSVVTDGEGNESRTDVWINADGGVRIRTVSKGSDGSSTTNDKTYDKDGNEVEPSGEEPGGDEEGDDGDEGEGGDEGESPTGDGSDSGGSDFGGSSDEAIGALIAAGLQHGGGGASGEHEGDGLGQGQYDEMLGSLIKDAAKGGSSAGGHGQDGDLDTLGRGPSISLGSGYAGSQVGVGGHSDFDDPYNPVAVTEFVQTSFGVGSYSALQSAVSAATG